MAAARTRKAAGDTDPTTANDDPTSKPATGPGSGRGGARENAGRKSMDDKLKESLTTQLSALGMALSGAGVVSQNPALSADGVSVIEHAEPVAESLVQLAKTNPKVKAFLTQGVEASGWLGVAIAVGALAKDIAGNHMNAIPAEATDAGPSRFDGLAQMGHEAQQQ